MTGAGTLLTADGLTLECEIAGTEPGPRAAAVLCHPHPQHGGSMRSFLVGELFRALPAAGVATLRFNFRGVERSEGAWDGGVGERLDARAALDTLSGRVETTVPLVMAGWSFGADLALATVDDRVTAWLAIAPPLRFAGPLDTIGADPRRKAFVLGGRDAVVRVDGVRARTDGWVATRVDVVPGATHFFLGRSDEVVAAALRLVDAVSAG